MPRFRLAIALTGLVLLPAPALAAAPWSEPVTITAASPQVAEQAITIGANGRAVLSARLTTQAQGFPTRGFSRLFGQQADGGFVGRARLVLAAPPVAYGASRLALLRLPLAKGNATSADLDDPATSMGYSFGRCCGPLEVEPGAYRRLTTRADRFSGTIAASARGDVAAAWIEHLPGRDHLVVAVRRPGQPFGRPSVIGGSGFFSSASIAWGANGDLLVAYQRSISRRGRPTDRRVEARVRRAGHSWGAAQRLGASSGFSDISTAAAANGRMVVAWGTQDGGEEANTPWIVRAAVRQAGPHRFRSAQALEVSEGDDERPAGEVAAAMAPDGTATVAWSSIAGASRPHTFPLRAATADASLRFAAPQTLHPNAAAHDVAMDARGTTVVAWSTLAIPGVNQIEQQVFASLRVAGQAAFAAPEAVSPAERAEQPRVALNPQTGRPAVVWVSRLDGVSNRLRYAAR